MVDLHCHILPGRDDGAKSLGEALAMAYLAHANGITDLVATPHAQNGVYHNDRADVLNGVAALQEELERVGIPLRLHPGMEVHVHVDLLENLRGGELLTLCDGSNYLLLELPERSIPSCTESILHELQVLGVTPILAHPERNKVLQTQPDRLAEWMETGMLVQLTGGSLLGQFGRSAQRAAEEMVRRNLAHLIASDGHGAESRRPYLRAAYRRLAKVASRSAVWEFRERALAVLRGEPCRTAEPLGSGMGKRWLWF